MSAACHKEVAPEQVISATFMVDTPATKVINDGLSATKLLVRIFDSNHELLQEETYTRGDGGWLVKLTLVPSVYSISFWACSPESDAFSFEDEFVTVDYNKMDMNSDVEDAFWASLADMEMTTSISRTVTLKRPLACVQLVSDTFLDEDLKDATSSFRITGMISTKLNLITGEAGEARRKVSFAAAPIADYAIDRHPVVALAYALVDEAGITAAEVEYTITMKDGRVSEGAVINVPMERNHLTTLKDY